MTVGLLTHGNEPNFQDSLLTAREYKGSKQSMDRKHMKDHKSLLKASRIAEIIKLCIRRHQHSKTRLRRTRSSSFALVCSSNQYLVLTSFRQLDTISKTHYSGYRNLQLRSLRRHCSLGRRMRSSGYRKHGQMLSCSQARVS